MTDLPAYQLIRSSRRTLSICVDREGALVVRAPLRMAVRDIEAFIDQKRDWIIRKQTQARAHERFVMEDGAQLPWLEGFLTIRLAEVRRAVLQDGCLLLPSEQPAQAAIKWRKKRAEEVLLPRVEYWAGVTGLHPSSVAFTNARRRWGSMNSQGSLRLNAALLHCPAICRDYVIVHELCHLLHPDHSPAFHMRVRSFLPEADAVRIQMKALGDLTEIL